MVNFKRTQYRDYEYPVLWDVLGWMIPLAIVLCIPVTACIKICRTRFSSKDLTLKQVCHALLEYISVYLDVLY
jgi:Sodium:neurotransmitter symporter family